MKISRILILACLVFAACSTEDDGGSEVGGNTDDNFDRAAMLANWADNIILPSFQNLNEETQKLEELANSFAENPGNSELTALRNQFKVAYQDFQSVSMFDIGKAEELNYRSFVNTYPLNSDDVESKIS